ncbi:Aliphatic amidase expression-regulating protein [Hartmannibacter diazotrophicus]|uniref:Aliphatic amidase expression-regulating protein n=1 Tax=Hartmannibacter diazotrophicus TaxID=1482074 RepID=A0A2C9D7B3_9HYPH|nr:transporter substrate-binding domain-containing protein [Hartmannibacter diazotrophicus]SON55641.1 Aliphatic amidase expression-regulating protein [Hartmannibacter diazotrophicus]
MSRIRIPIGLMFSQTGSYGTVGQSMLNGALLACCEVNEDRKLGIELEPMIADPASRLSAYAPTAENMIDAGIRHVVGCYTSSSRKEVIPIFEKRDALLWYPTHYEGFESSENVVYTGAAPNHHLSPLIDFLFNHFGGRAFCVGSNYIWGWESNRTLREGIQARGGMVLAERYVAVGETEMDRVVESIFDLKPDFVFNALIGESSYAFFRAFRKACEERGIDQRTRFPVASCNLSEPELKEIGPDAMDGHFSSSVYFASIDTPESRAFVSAYDAGFPEGPAASAEAEAAFVAVKLLAQSLHDAGTTDLQQVKRAVSRQMIDAPQGRVSIDPETLHAFLTPRIGRSRKDGQFDIVAESNAPVRPDPYLIRSSAPLEARHGRPALRVVS